MKILGISAYYHDSAAALVVDGVIAAAAQEERFTRNKNDASFPKNAIRYCLEAASCELSDIDYVVYYEKPLLKLDRLLETYLSFAPKGFASFRHAIPLWVKEKMFLRRELSNGLREVADGVPYRGTLVYTQHHESHAASAFFPSPFEEAAVLTIDGVGEWATSTIGKGAGSRIEMISEQHFPHSLGLLYSAFTYYTGFKVNGGEYKLMGLAPYGEPKYCSLIEGQLIDLKEDGSFTMDMQYFDFCVGLTMTNRRFDELFGQSPRQPESELTQFYMDVAASIQKTTEKIVLRMVAHCRELVPSKNLCLAGGVALNCVANGLIAKQGDFENLWIQPAAGDSGGALGAALFVWHQLLENERVADGRRDCMQGSYLGPATSEVEIAQFLKEKNVESESYESDGELAKAVAALIAEQNVVGWYQGRLEFGPRALGGRSILGDPRSPEMQSVINMKIKFRESFRPFAPSVLAERSRDYFDLPDHLESPYMLLVGEVKEAHRVVSRVGDESAVGLDKLGLARSTVPAITHVDHTARVQTVSESGHPLYRKLLEAFESLTGCPMLINTSFNVRGEPVVCSLDDAWNCFLTTKMDALALGHHVVLKKSMKPAADNGNKPANMEGSLS